MAPTPSAPRTRDNRSKPTPFKWGSPLDRRSRSTRFQGTYNEVATKKQNEIRAAGPAKKTNRVKKTTKKPSPKGKSKGAVGKSAAAAAKKKKSKAPAKGPKKAALKAEISKRAAAVLVHDVVSANSSKVRKSTSSPISPKSHKSSHAPIVARSKSKTPSRNPPSGSADESDSSSVRPTTSEASFKSDEFNFNDSP
ncbi:hypothetical protein K504DRAFT_538198 [Pleomassaria siparia CBS 279.74]|uniref:Uncharacterized protein n=1 Tax=Pleomassaria siparia CBS 279.74 TaxID=1314801 RepID=A0A6G1JUB9_9PLEO|nr:hypothetical protein K504DRAFT_538198 [Pleomassaria siparia CBS 279.74]